MPISLWDTALSLRVGGGYRDNILLAHVAPEGSALISAEMDFSLMRLSETGSEWMLFVLGQDSEYTERQEVDGERLVSAVGRWMQQTGEGDKLGAGVSYLYQNQVLDVSESQEALRRVLVEGHSAGLGPEWRHRFGSHWAAELTLRGQRQMYLGEELDDYWEAAGTWRLVRSYARDGQVALGFQSTHWLWDERQQTDENGRLLDGTSLYYWRPELFAEWRHFFDKAKRWRSISRVGWLWNLDNGTGYHDYDRFTLVERLRWRHANWELSGALRTGWYWYGLQEFGGEGRERGYLSLELRVERHFGKHFLVYASGEREWNLGTDPLDDYRDWRVVGGVGFEL